MADTAIGSRFGRVAILASGLAFAACSGGGGGGNTPGGVIGTRQLESIQYGRLADVYGLQDGTVELFRRDVLIGRNIHDERVSGQASEGLADAAVDYDFQGADPDTLQPRLLIPRQIGSAAFNTLFVGLDQDLGEVTAMKFGDGAPGRPYSVVPRNAAIRLQFTGAVGVGDEFFVVRNAQGQVTGLRNTEAVQLLQIAGDPTVAGNFVPLPVRIVVGVNSLTLDPVLLGSEGLQYETRNNASGLPASPDTLGANIRIALALDGPLAIPSLRSDTFTGLNNAGRSAIIRDFRSGNDTDSGGADLSRGFVRDSEPPRLIGEMAMYLERVDAVNATTVQVTLFKGGIVHEIDRGDLLRFIVDANALPFGSSEVVVDPLDDQSQASVQHVRVRVRAVPNLESIDPTNRPDFPTIASEVEPWLRLHAPRAVLVAEFQGGQVDATGALVRPADDGRYFGLFTPTPLPLLDGTPSQPNENVSPFAGAVIRFSKPVDLGTVKSADTMFFATRNLTDRAAIDEFIATRPWQIDFFPGSASGIGMDPSAFNEDKFRTPHLIASRVLDEDGSQTTLRLQPLQGFYLDPAMRQDGPRPYYLHLLTGSSGIRDLAGNPIDLQTNDINRSRGLVIPFTLDTRTDGVRPRFEDNLAVYMLKRFQSPDEDENPSYYLPSEVQGPVDTRNAKAQPLQDLFGSFATVDGRIQGRPTTRVRKVADDQNQAPFDPQESLLRWCPFRAGEDQVASNTATAALGNGVQNPLNPYGCRLQTVWREIDLSLSRADPTDFNLDIEQMYWAPFTDADVTFDEFDRVTLVLGHSERRPEPCVGVFGSLPTFTESGLGAVFERNYVRNLRANAGPENIETAPAKHFAFNSTPSRWQIDPQAAFLEATGTNRYMPMPAFKRPYFVYRDETLTEQGCAVGLGSDVNTTVANFRPWILSPWPNGAGRRSVQDVRVGKDPNLTFPIEGFWNSANNFNIRNRSGTDAATDGLVGNVALPLLADFFVECDSSTLPAGNGYVAQGFNGWQISVALQSSPQPNFRIYSAGRPPFPNLAPICKEPGSTSSANGGYAPPPPLGVGGQTPNGDNTFYWVMLDFLKRASVITNGFIDLYNPHRVPNGFADSRLGPYLTSAAGQVSLPAGVLPRFSYEFEPPLTQLPAGTSVVPQFRAASAVDPAPWHWQEWINLPTAPALPPYGPDANPTSGSELYPPELKQQLKPTPDNFPLDPFKAGDAHIRKFDDRLTNGTSGVARNWWTYFYNRTVTSFVGDPNQLMDIGYLSGFAGPNEGFSPTDVRYVNWRLLMSNNIDASPPVSPSIETFSFAYRFQRVAQSRAAGVDPR